MIEEEAVECAYCGCTNIDCLAKSPETGLYLCNGRGLMTQSHFVDFLIQTRNYELSFPEGHPYHQTEFECYVCKSRNIFRLGFVTFVHQDDEVYICCRSPCQFDKRVIDGRIHNFHPIITNGIITDILLRQPDNREFSVVQKDNIIPLIEEINEKYFVEKFGNIPKARLSYTSLSHYQEIMKKFIFLEEKAYADHEDTLRFNELYPNWDSRLECNFKANLSLFRACSIGTLLRFKCKDQEIDGKIFNMTKDGFIYVKFLRECPFFGKIRDVSCTVVLNSRTFERYKTSLQRLVSNKNCMHRVLFHVFIGNFQDVVKFNKAGLRSIRFEQPISPSFPELNTFQIKATEQALSNHFSVIQGPPGSGKTTVIAAIVNSFLKSGVSPILVLTKTDNAADLATFRCVQAGLDPTRVFSYFRESSDFNDDKIFCAVKGFDIIPYTSKMRAIQKYGIIYENARNREDSSSREKCTVMEREILRNSEVIITTASTAGGSRFKQLKFPVVIFDEASQCVEPEIVVGATHGAERLILVGDQKQPGPFVLANDSLLGRYDLSLMERAQLGNVDSSILRIQYRMHPAISTLSSVNFYDNIIQNGVSESDRSTVRPVLPWPNQSQPVFFWNIESQEEYYGYGTTLINRQEAKAVCELVDTMLANGVRPNQIAIITPYSGQQIYINDIIKEFSLVSDKQLLEDIEIASVDAFQGHEKDYVLLSCVRANSNHEIGFLGDKRRLNVSITHARYGLVIIGDAVTFMHNETWWNLLEFLRISDCFVEGSLGELRLSELPNIKEFDENDKIEQCNIYGLI